DTSAQARHGHAMLVARAALRGGWLRRGRRGRRGRRRLLRRTRTTHDVVLDPDVRRLVVGDVIENVPLRDAALAARAGNRGGIEVVLFDELAHGRAHLVRGSARASDRRNRRYGGRTWCA